MPGNDSYTVSLLHMNGSNGSTTFTDNAAGGSHIWTAYGNAQISTAGPEFGTGAGSFVVTGDYIKTPYSSDFDFGTGDFTWDFWFKFTSLPSEWWADLLGLSDDNGINWMKFQVAYVSLGVYEVDFFVYDLTLGDPGNPLIYYALPSWSPSINNWYHIAIVRSGTSLLLFIDGVSQSWSGDPTVGSKSLTETNHLPFYMGSAASFDGTFNGQLDEVRISKGIARWTSNFARPTSEYTLSSRTYILY
jgi:hypothetical protein